MKTKIAFMILSVLALQGCANLGVAYVPIDRDKPYDEKDAHRDLAQCRMKTLNRDQESACMYLKGYTLEQINLDTRQPVHGKPVRKSEHYKITEPLKPAENTKTLKDLQTVELPKQ